MATSITHDETTDEQLTARHEPIDVTSSVQYSSLKPHRVEHNKHKASTNQSATHGNGQLSWLGHTARIPFERLPRKLLSSWVFNRNPRGSPEFIMALGWFGIDRIKQWYEMRFSIVRGGWSELFNVYFV